MRNGVPLLIIHLLDHVVPRIASVVDDDVDTAEMIHRGLDETFTEVCSRHIACTDHGFAARFLDFIRDFVGGRFIEIIDDHACAFAR
jgi:hypothetical protein